VFERIIKWITVLAFVVEIISPATTFVRENVSSSSHHKNTAKIEKSNPNTQPDDSNSDSPDDDGYLACSAVVPAFFSLAKPNLIERTFVHVTISHPQTQTESIQRPPARS
jgi:hypothetical protein